MTKIEQSRNRIEKTIKDIESKMNDPYFLERLSQSGHIVASNFLDQVRVDLNAIQILVGRESPKYIELSEAVALIGSGCLRWATVKTRKLMSSSGFRKNGPLYHSEKNKIEKCYELIMIFSNMEMNDSSIRSAVLEVRNIVYQLHTQFQRRSNCYIATVVYNNPHSIEVLTFKYYRDNVLYKSYLGRILLSTYYFLSPKISKLLINRTKINQIIRKVILDPFYKKISNSHNIK